MVKAYTDYASLYHTTTYYDPEEKAFENIVGKGENAVNQHFFSSSHNTL